MNFLHLRYFIAVVENKGISKAANKIHITQQTLSSHIAHLEKELGATLFIRKPKFKLTHEGERLYRYALQLTETHNNLIQEFSDHAQKKIASLKIGVAHTRGRIVIPKLFAQYLETNPQVQITLIEQSNDELIDSLLSKKVDLAIARFNHALPELEITTLYQERMLLVAKKNLLPSAKPQVKDFSSLSFLLSDSKDIAGTIGEMELKKAGIVPKTFIRSSNIETVLELCFLGVGACFCPDTLLKNTASKKALSSLFILPVGNPYPISIAHQRSTYVPNAITEIKNLAKTIFENSGLSS